VWSRQCHIARRQLPSGTLHFYFSDHLGSSNVVASAAGQILDESDFYSFGGERIITSSTDNPYLFTGKERDSESGLDYFGARHFSSHFGCFLQADAPFADQEVSDPQSWNLYTYVRNKPTEFIDPTGRGLLKHLWKAATAVAKGESALATFGVVKEKIKDAFDSKKPLADRIEAAGSALSEVVLPLSMQDGADLGELAGEAISEFVDNPTPALAVGTAAGGTYTLRDRETGEVERSGRTNDLERRRGEHARAEDTKDFRFKVEEKTDAPKTRRGLEQVLHDKHRPPLNKINPIAPGNPQKPEFMRAAWEFLKKKARKK
jgi:RHS repeat-associated protein